MRKGIVVSCALACLLAACAPPAPVARTPVASAIVLATPASHLPVAKASVFAPGNIDRSCKLDSDCAVKNVGNCCGRYPACVNKDAPVNPEAVKAQCLREHRMSVCNVPMIGSCSCVHDQCSNNSGTSASGNL